MKCVRCGRMKPKSHLMPHCLVCYTEDRAMKGSQQDLERLVNWRSYGIGVRKKRRPYLPPRRVREFLDTQDPPEPAQRCPPKPLSRSRKADRVKTGRVGKGQAPGEENPCPSNAKPAWS